jgi:hypothetical protein
VQSHGVGTKTGGISFTIDTNHFSPYIELDYLFDGKSINYKISLITIPSNLGKGSIWYFVCPETGKQCRKLYLSNGYFLHRTAFSDLMYEAQTKSHFIRKGIFKDFTLYIDAACKLNKKNFKRYYKGIPTNRYLKLINKLQCIDTPPLD